MNFNESKYKEISEPLFQNFEYFEQFRGKFEKIFQQIINHFVFSWHEIRLLFILSLFKNYFEDPFGEPSQLFKTFVYKILEFPDDRKKIFFKLLGQIPIAIRNFVDIAQNFITLYCISNSDKTYFMLKDQEILSMQNFILELRKTNCSLDVPRFPKAGSAFLHFVTISI